MPALDEDTLLGRGADAAEVAERNGDHERAGAGDDQQDKRPVQPFVERPVPGQRRDDRHQRRDEHHGGRVVAGEAGDEVLAGGLLLAGVFHQVQNLRDCGLPALLPRLSRPQG